MALLLREARPGAARRAARNGVRDRRGGDAALEKEAAESLEAVGDARGTGVRDNVVAPLALGSGSGAGEDGLEDVASCSRDQGWRVE